MRNAVWFGTENDMRWIPAPAANYDTSFVGWQMVDQYMNGGSGTRKSTVKHKELSLTWPVQSQESLAPLVSYLQQEGPFFYIDPLNAQSNVIPSYWANPSLVEQDDGPYLVDTSEYSYENDSSGISLGYPIRCVRFVLDEGSIVWPPDGKVYETVYNVIDGVYYDK